MSADTERRALTAREWAASRAAQMTEAQLQALVVQAAEFRGWLTYHPYDSRRSNPGFPDLVLVRGTRIAFRELKTQTGPIRREQQRWLADLAHAGDAAIWRPLDWFTGAIEADLAAELPPTATRPPASPEGTAP